MSIRNSHEADLLNNNNLSLDFKMEFNFDYFSENFMGCIFNFYRCDDFSSHKVE
ncbi:MAG: hypothetical protein Kapaf2KO_17830 [Candidatus Kapaibacteriales bacterium]